MEDTDPKLDFDELVDFGLPAAVELLSEDGRFHPFGATITESEPDFAVFDSAKAIASAGRSHLEVLRQELSEGVDTGLWKASALFYAASVRQPESGAILDAVNIELWHAMNDPMQVACPYLLLDGELEFGPPFALPDGTLPSV